MAGKIRDVSAYIVTDVAAPPNPDYATTLRKVQAYAITAKVDRTLTVRKVTGYAVGAPIVRTLGLRAITGYALVAKIDRSLLLRGVTSYVAVSNPERTLNLRKVQAYAVSAPPPERTLTLRKVSGYAITAKVERTLTLRTVTGYVAGTPVRRTLELRKVTGYVVAGPAIIRTLTLRKVQGYVATKIVGNVSVREVHGSALIRAERLPPFHTPSIKGLLTTINMQHKARFVESDLIFGPPLVRTNDPDYNSSLLLTATNTSLYDGQMMLRYNRVALSKAFFRKDITELRTFGTTMTGSLAGINAKYALALTVEDIVDGPIAAGATKVTLTISANSYYYLPGTAVTLGV